MIAARRYAASVLIVALLAGCAGVSDDAEPDADAARKTALEAIAESREALDREPDNPEMAYRLGNQLFDLGRYAEAAQAYERAVRLKPDYAAAYTNLGLALRRLGQFRAAIGAYETALDLDPGDATTLRNLVAAADLAGDAARAVSARRRLLDAAPDDLATRTALARILFEQGRYGEAAETYAWIIAHDPGQADDYFILGRCHYFLDDLDAAERNWLKALELDPQHASAHRALAALYWRRGNLDRAWAMVERCRERSIPLDPEFIEALEGAPAPRP